jgi:hypothetical protein
MSITAASAIVSIGIPLLFPTPQQLQGFAPDAVFDIPAIKSAEATIGVDGKKSAGFVFVLVPIQYMLQADSNSNSFFDTWHAQNTAAQDDYAASGLILVPSIGTKYILTNGSLTEWKPGPDAKKLLQPRRHEITWESIQAAPI